MTDKNTQPAPSGPAKRIPTAAERRAAQIAQVADKQAQLKREATERRERRAQPRD
jgi:hypothetical protein